MTHDTFGGDPYTPQAIERRNKFAEGHDPDQHVAVMQASGAIWDEMTWVQREVCLRTLDVQNAAGYAGQSWDDLMHNNKGIAEAFCTLPEDKRSMVLRNPGLSGEE